MNRARATALARALAVLSDEEFDPLAEGLTWRGGALTRPLEEAPARALEAARARDEPR